MLSFIFELWFEDKLFLAFIAFCWLINVFFVAGNLIMHGCLTRKWVAGLLLCFTIGTFMGYKATYLLGSHSEKDFLLGYLLVLVDLLLYIILMTFWGLEENGSENNEENLVPNGRKG